MSDSKFYGEVRLVTAAAFLAGPCMALLYETDALSLGPSGTLWPIAFVTIAAGTGAATGITLASRVSRLLGAVVVVPNLLVLLLYGFLLLFFGLGGSR